MLEELLMKYPTSNNGYVVELYLTENRSFIVDAITEVTPTAIQIGIGDIADIPLSSNIISAILNDIPEIESVVLPVFIPTLIVNVVYPITNLKVPKFYIREGDTGMDIGAYSAKPGYLPDKINLYHRLDNVEMETTADGMIPIDKIKKQIDDKNDLPVVDDGFHPLPKGDLDGVVDGFHEIPVEKRDMWEEDPRRMNRLSYLPIANILDVDTFPKELGGGRIQ